MKAATHTSMARLPYYTKSVAFQSHVFHTVNSNLNGNENIQWTHFNFHILDLSAPVHSLMCTNMAVSHKQINLSILLAVLALAQRGHHVILGLCIVHLFTSNRAILCFCLSVKC